MACLKKIAYRQKWIRKEQLVASGNALKKLAMVSIFLKWLMVINKNAREGIVSMKVIKNQIESVLIIEPKVFGDERSFFLETLQAERYHALAGIDLPFVQDNHSRSGENVLRGLHFQKAKPQGKLVRGEVLVVDIRQGSSTYALWAGGILSEEIDAYFTYG